MLLLARRPARPTNTGVWPSDGFGLIRRSVIRDSPIAIFSRSRNLLAAAILFAPAVASASPTYTAGVTTVPIVQNSPTPVVLSGFENASGGRHGEGAVRADSTTGGHALAVCPAGNGLSEQFSFDAVGNYDDIVIEGPVAGATVPFTLHVVVNANFLQDWSTITHSAFTDASNPGNRGDFSVRLLTPAGFPEGRLVVDLFDQPGIANLQLTGQVVPTGDPGPGSSETLGGVTIFHNVPLGSGGFLNLLRRVQTPITSSGGDPGAGFAEEDIVELRAEILVTGTATVGSPFTLILTLEGASTATSGSEVAASATMDVGDSFGVPQDGSPVFDLPSGFTASSASLNIVDNVVPEPASLAASATALLALASRLPRSRLATRPAPRAIVTGSRR